MTLPCIAERQSLWFWKFEKQPNVKLSWYLFPWKNRFFRLALILLSVLLCTAIIYGWQPFSAMLFAENVYGWKCTAEDLAAHEQAVLADPLKRYEAACNAQDSLVQAIFTVNMTTEFTAGAIAGVSLYFLGPFLTGLIGQILVCTGILFLALASVHWPSLYLVSAALLGGASNFIVFPAFTMTDYFPNNKALVASTVIGFQNGSSSIALVLNAIYHSNQSLTIRSLFLGFLAFLTIPSLLFVLAMPLVRPNLNPDYVHPTKDYHVAVETAAVRSKDPAEMELELTKDELDLKNSPSETASAGHGNQGHSINVVATEETSKKDCSTNAAAFTRTSKQDLLTIEMLMIAILTVLFILQMGFYPTVIRNIGGENLASMNGYLLPTQAIWAIIFGALVDRFGTLPTCHATSTMIAVVYIFCLIPNEKLQYVATAIFVLAGSFAYTAKFTYIQETFHPRNHGILLGVLSGIGLVSLINIPLKNLLDYKPVVIGMLISTGISFAVVGILQIRNGKGINYITDDKIKRISLSAKADTQPRCALVV